MRALLTYNGKYRFYVVKDARWVTSDININRRCSVSTVVGARSGATLGISHLRGFERLILTPPGGSANTFKTGRRPPRGRRRAHWSGYISSLASKRLGFPQKESENVAGGGMSGQPIS